MAYSNQLLNLGGLVDRVLSDMDWELKGAAPDLEVRVKDQINRALAALAVEKPWLLAEAELEVDLLADFNYVSEEATDRVEVVPVGSADRNVLQRPSGGTLKSWDTSGKWDGRWIEAKSTESGEWLERRILEVWQDVGGTGNFRLSLDKPWPNTTDASMEYRIFTKVVYLPADVIEIRDKGLYIPDRAYGRYSIDMEFRGPENLTYGDYSTAGYTGRPFKALQAPPHQLQPPLRPPSAALDASETPATWDGPEPFGTFQYCVTIGWGRQGHTEDLWDRFRPTFESPPSAPSDEIIVPVAGNAVVISLVNLDWERWFNRVLLSPPPLDARSTRTGLYYRIWRRRLATTSDATNTPSGLSEHISSPGIWYLWKEVGTNVEEVTDDGSQLADITQPLGASHSQLGFYISPRPDKDYPLRVRCTRNHPPLINEYETPSLIPGAIDVLVYKALSLVYSTFGRPDLAAAATGDYETKARSIKNRIGSQVRGVRRRKAARVR
jgi:hypothetical protein